MHVRSVPLLLVCLALLQFPASLSAQKPLAEAAGSFSKPLEKGMIVTAEGTEGALKYSATGKDIPKDTPPELLLFEIGSITKVFTGLLLAQAVVEGKVTLDTTVRDLMGKDQKFADSRVGAITLRQLATHTSGLPRLPKNLSDGVDKGNPYGHYDRAKLNAAMADMRLTGEPPFDPDYSNLGVGLLGDLLSRLYNKPWDTLIAEKITGPLGLKDTVTTLSAEQEKRFTTASEGGDKVSPWTFQALAGCGALRSTAADLVTFAGALLHPEKTPLKDAITLMEQPQTKDGYSGLALMISKPGGQMVYEHNGGTAGYRSVLQVVPATGLIRIMLSNNGAAPLEKVLAAARGEKPRTQESGKTLTQEQLAAYQGVYQMSGTSHLTVLLRDGQLWSQLTGQSFFHIFPHEDADRFFFKVVAAELLFNRGPDGSVNALTLFQNGRSTKAQKTTDPVPTIIFRSAKDLAEYVGTYPLLPGMTFTVKVQDATLFVQLSGQPFAPVFERRPDRFEYDTVEAALEFERDKDGKIIALNLQQNGQTLRAVKQ